MRYTESHVACLAIVDIDYFKRVNDIKGHDQGDLVIIGIGNILTRLTRNTDFVARVGGEEYGIILPHTDIDAAKRLLVRVCEEVANTTSLSVTISIGITDISVDSSRTYKCADIALYEAKTQGRNQVCVCKNTDDIA
jgi:diguanylate cyclase (GGDEF)-like protein